VTARRRAPRPLALAFGRAVRELREAKRFSVATVASGAAMTADRVREIERGADDPLLDEIFRLAEALDVAPSELIARAVAQGVQP